MNIHPEIYDAATALRRRGHLVDLSPAPFATGGFTFVVDGKAFTFHEFLDFAGVSRIPARA